MTNPASPLGGEQRHRAQRNGWTYGTKLSGPEQPGRLLRCVDHPNPAGRPLVSDTAGSPTREDPTRVSTEPSKRPYQAAPLPVKQRDELVALLAPYLRAGTDYPDELTDLDVLVDARPLEVLDALHAAGVLVYDDISDRAHLRKSWAAMSTALLRLSKDEPLTPDVLAAVPSSHRFYLMGHEAAHRQLSQIWSQLLGTRLFLETLLTRGTTPMPVEIGEAVELLGGENRYAGDRRPAVADPWWGCWTDRAADPGPFHWERYKRTCDPDAPLDGLGDLCAFLGGTWSEDSRGASITASILHLIVKAQNTPERFAQVERAFPREVTAWRVWRSMSPTPTARELYEQLTGPDTPAAEVPPATADDGSRIGVLPPFISTEADQGLPRAAVNLAAAVAERVRAYADAIVVDSVGNPEVMRAGLPDFIAGGLPDGARAYALPWPVGTRASYHPDNGVGFQGSGPDAELLWRDLYVEDPAGRRVLLGMVRRLAPHEKRRGHGRHAWDCRYCHLGATNAKNPLAENAERAGHEAICPDRDDQETPATVGRPRSAVSPGDPDWVPGFGPVPGASLGDLGDDW